MQDSRVSGERTTVLDLNLVLHGSITLDLDRSLIDMATTQIYRSLDVALDSQQETQRRQQRGGRNLERKLTQKSTRRPLGENRWRDYNIWFLVFDLIGKPSLCVLPRTIKGSTQRYTQTKGV